METFLLRINKSRLTILTMLALLSLPERSHAANFLAVGCKILTLDGQVIRSFPHGMCQYLDDGSYIAIDPGRSLAQRIDRNGNTLWTATGQFHHQFKMSLSKKRIAVIEKASKIYFGVDVDFDKLSLLDIQTGKRLTSLPFSRIYSQLLDPDSDTSVFRMSSDRRISLNRILQTTHTNSIMEIMRTPLSKKNKAFAPGNWLVNPLFSDQLAIFNKDLTKLIFKIRIPRSLTGRMTHDFQLLPDGKIAFYANGAPMKNGPSHVAIMTFNPLESPPTFQERIIYDGGKMFRQLRAGGFQFLDNGDYIVSIYSDTLGFQLARFDHEDHEIWRITPFPNPLTNYGDAFQGPKLIDASEFLKNNTQDF